MTLVEKWTQQLRARSKGVSYAGQRINETHLRRHCHEALAFGAGIFLHNFAWGLRLLIKRLSWIGWQLYEYTTASASIILLEGLSAVLSSPSPGHSPLPHNPPPPNTGFKVYQHISCKSFLYLGDSMHMRNKDEYHSHLKVAAEWKRYSKEKGITLRFSHQSSFPENSGKGGYLWRIQVDT